MVSFKRKILFLLIFLFPNFQNIMILCSDFFYQFQIQNLGVTDCPVAPLSEAPTVGTQRPGDVASAPDGVRCAHRQTASPTTILVVGAINTPQPPHFNASKFFSHQTSYKSSRLHSKTQKQRTNPLQVPYTFQRFSGL